MFLLYILFDFVKRRGGWREEEIGDDLSSYFGICGEDDCYFV